MFGGSIMRRPITSIKTVTIYRISYFNSSNLNVTPQQHPKQRSHD